MKIDLEDFIQNAISDFEAENGISNMWKPPLVSAIPANHPLLPSLKQIATGDHLLPEELLPGAKSVVVFFVPFDDRIIESNIKGEAASREWANAYVITNKLLAFIGDELENRLIHFSDKISSLPGKEAAGFQIAKIKATHNFDKNTLLSRWSHRHIAWIAGLGTFGINNMLITEKGCCGRLGSLVTNVECGIFISSNSGAIKPVPEKCLFKINGSCGLCRERCPIGAHNEIGSFKRHDCYEICLKNSELHHEIGHADICGKCLVGLPCSIADPSISARK